MEKATQLPFTSPVDKDASSEEALTENKTEFRVYKKRWLILVNLSLLNLGLSMIWLGCSPVAYKVANYYTTPVSTINWLSMIFLIAAIPCGIVCMWLMNRMGLRACMLVSTWTSLIGAALRICSTIESLPDHWKLVCLFAGQIMAAVVLPLASYSSPKLTALWFPSSQRSISTTITGMSNPLGVVVTGLISPLFVNEAGIVNMRYMLIAYTGLPLFVALMTTIVMTSDAPPTPPSYGGTVTTSKDFLGDVKNVLLHNRSFVILMVSVGSGIALYTSFATLLEQVLCPWGYTDEIAGVCSSVMTGAGLIGAVVASLIVDKTKRFSEALKFMFIAASIATIVFSVTHRNYMGYWIVLEMAMIGFLAFGISPIGVETGAECTFPAGVSICVGLLQISGQVQSLIMIAILQSIGHQMSAEELQNSKCHSSLKTTYEGSGEEEPITYNMTVSAYVMTGLVCTVSLIFCIFFRPTYKRLLAEREAALSSSVDGGNVVKPKTIEVGCDECINIQTVTNVKETMKDLSEKKE